MEQRRRHAAIARPASSSLPLDGTPNPARQTRMSRESTNSKHPPIPRRPRALTRAAQKDVSRHRLSRAALRF